MIVQVLFKYSQMQWTVRALVSAVLTVLLICGIGMFILAGAGPGAASSTVTPSVQPPVVKNPYAGNAEAVNEGKKLFTEKCSECHGDGTGGAGPDLTDDRWLYGSSDADLFETISFGRKGGMPSWAIDLSKDERWKVITFIRSLSNK